MLREPLMQTLTDVIRQPRSTFDIATVVGVLRNHGGADGDIEASANATTVDRFLLYRRLVHGRFMGALQVSIPRTIARIIARIGAEAIARDLEEFIHRQATASPYLRDIAPEFVAFSSARWRDDDTMPNYVADLALHELLTIDIAAATDDKAKSPIHNVDLDTRLHFQNAARLVRYQHAVHRLPDDEADRTEPVRGDWHLLGYRDDEYRVRFLELTPLAAAVIERLIKGESLREAATVGCAQSGLSLDDEALTTIAILLEDLDQRGVFTGVRAMGFGGKGAKGDPKPEMFNLEEEEKGVHE